MKKALLLALAVVFCFMLVGCGEKEVTDDQNVVEPSTGIEEVTPDVDEPVVPDVIDAEVPEEDLTEVSGEELVISGEVSESVISGEDVLNETVAE